MMPLRLQVGIRKPRDSSLMSSLVRGTGIEVCAPWVRVGSRRSRWAVSGWPSRLELARRVGAMVSTKLPKVDTYAIQRSAT